MCCVFTLDFYSFHHDQCVAEIGNWCSKVFLEGDPVKTTLA